MGTMGNSITGARAYLIFPARASGPTRTCLVSQELVYFQKIVSGLNRNINYTHEGSK